MFTGPCLGSISDWASDLWLRKIRIPRRTAPEGRELSIFRRLQTLQHVVYGSDYLVSVLSLDSWREIHQRHVYPIAL
jgi:hypothetical protein